MESEHELLKSLGDLIVSGTMFEIEEFVGVVEWVALAREEGHYDVVWLPVSE